MIATLLSLAWAGFGEEAGAPDPPPHRKSTFRPGRIQVRVGGGIEFNGIGGGSVLSIAEGWHPLSTALDIALVNAGPVTIGIGAELGVSRQFFVNPLMRARVALGEKLPPWLGFTPGPEGEWNWKPQTIAKGGRLHVHLQTLEGHPYLVVVGEHHSYRNDMVHRETGREHTHLSDIWGVSAGAGSSSVLPSGFLLNVEVRYGFPVWTSTPHDLAIDGSELRVLRRMRPPPGVIFMASAGFRL